MGYSPGLPCSVLQVITGHPLSVCYLLQFDVLRCSAQVKVPLPPHLASSPVCKKKKEEQMDVDGKFDFVFRVFNFVFFPGLFLSTLLSWYLLVDIVFVSS